MRWMALTALLATAACSEPRFGAAISATPGGNVKVSPSVSGNLGGLTVAVQG